MKTRCELPGSVYYAANTRHSVASRASRKLFRRPLHRMGHVRPTLIMPPASRARWGLGRGAAPTPGGWRGGLGTLHSSDLITIFTKAWLHQLQQRISTITRSITDDDGRQCLFWGVGFGFLGLCIQRSSLSITLIAQLSTLHV